MPLVIDNPETERLVEELARKTGHKPVDEVASYPDVDTRSADELIGYDEHGVPR